MGAFFKKIATESEEFFLKLSGELDSADTQQNREDFTKAFNTSVPKKQLYRLSIPTSFFKGKPDDFIPDFQPQ